MPESDPALLPLCTHLKIFLIHFQSYNSFRWPVMKACVTNLFKGRSSRHEGERGMGRSKWFATSQRLRVIAAMVKGKAWRKVILTKNLFGKMVAGLGLPFQILILASLVTIVLPTTPRHKIGGLCWLTGWNLKQLSPRDSVWIWAPVGNQGFREFAKAVKYSMA